MTFATFLCYRLPSENKSKIQRRQKQITKLNWEKAKRNSIRNQSRSNKKFKAGQEQYRKNLERVVKKNNLKCFKCKSSKGPWAKIGNNNYGLWAICVECVKNRS